MLHLNRLDPTTAATGRTQDLVFNKFLAINYCTKCSQILTQPSGYSFQQHQLVTSMGCHIENLYLHRFSSSAFSSNFAVVDMFSATDVAQMVWDSDSDDGEMKGGSDVEIEEHASRFFCKNYCFHRVTKKESGSFVWYIISGLSHSSVTIKIIQIIVTAFDQPFEKCVFVSTFVMSNLS